MRRNPNYFIGSLIVCIIDTYIDILTRAVRAIDVKIPNDISCNRQALPARIYLHKRAGRYRPNSLDTGYRFSNHL